MTLRLRDHWVWDAWYAVDEDLVHAFFLRAPRALTDPDRRHGHARVGHAVSRDLRTWEDLGVALDVGAPGAFDSRAIWTGSVIRHDGRWLMFYTGIGADERDWTQRIGLAVSDDLATWRRTDVVIEADGRWYEKVPPGGIPGSAEEHWRDPWAWVDDAGTVHLLITARANDGPSDGRGVVAHAWSRDLRSWEVGPPVSQPGELRQVEVPQLLTLGGRWRIIVNARAGDHSAVRRARPGFVAESGVAVMEAPAPLGPYRLTSERFLLGTPDERFYCGRIVELRGVPYLIAFADADASGQFVGELTDPIRVHVDGGGELRLDAADVAAVHAPAAGVAAR